MDKIIAIDKPKDYTSRDIVNIVSKKFGTKKVGHTGTLDPLATGILVICTNKYLKLVENLMNHDKEYIAEVVFGIDTDTLDITGNILNKKDKIIIKDVKVSVFVREDDKGYNVSFRSKDGINVREIAESFGGGGHTAASGCVINEELDVTRTKLLERVRKSING